MTTLCAAQPKLTDSLPLRYLPGITVVGRNSITDIHQLPEVVGTSIYAGKKNALIVMDNVKGNVVTNTMRQVLAKVPGIHVWESDGSGIQIGIAARGLSPNRSWEFNVRQNGYDISADPFGYPEAYYNPQLQAVQRIEIVRGHGSLQYGPQFGGLVNYILRNGSEISKPLQFETQQTIGSNGLFNSYNALGGTNGKVHYYTFFDHRNAVGWRQNSTYFTNTGFGSFTWKPNRKWSVTAELMHAHQRSQQPGGLTDSQFREDARQSFRSRNWFDIHWTTAAIIADYQINSGSKLNIKTFYIAGNRNSLGYLKAINLPDSVNPTTGAFNSRTLDIDHYRNAGMEARYLTDYKLGKSVQTLSAGIRLYAGNTYRFRDGIGTTGADYTSQLLSPVWPRELQYHSFNSAVFAEQIFRWGKFLLIPGVRWELVSGKAEGINGYTQSGTPVFLQSQSRNRSFVLAGVGTEYHVGKKAEFYGNITQAYRPMQFADLTAPPTTDEIDQQLKDARGYNADFGFRGRLRSFLFFDISFYQLQYNNRIGTITQQRTDGSFYNFRTNVGNSSSRGLEALVEWSIAKALFPKWKETDIIVFVSYNYNHARYGDFKVITKNGNALVTSNLKNKQVENAPEQLIRAGINLQFRKLTVSLQGSSVGATFSDANNTVTATQNGQVGLIPGYTVLDWNATYLFSSVIQLKAGINNLTDTRYFTRRSGGYPGPGILPSDGRNVYLSIGATF